MLWQLRQLACALLLLTACAEPQATFTAIDGSTVQPMPQPADAAVVWVFVTTTCPIANAYAAEISQIADDYKARSVRFLVVHIDPTIDADDMKRHAKEYDLRCAVVADREHVLVRTAGAVRTPEAALFDAAGELRYRGRIDDRFPDLNARRIPTTSELRDALDAVLAGRTVAEPRTEATGCLIETPVH